ncbi:HipA domain-containing protein [Flavihumibacter cheonanensis]|uniref:type II toxin-antitoxin system HipA family toxin n=1 Tax=Flavihumibacter cheonanensis TaxID=1442385 RepID=UPI001EF8AAD2|nr:HipA domain-containing protein [Flavihumibacter cheonanensis]MCG7754508.1 HipA domain-containing protein [Flavihumibacter cheonanensis]
MFDGKKVSHILPYDTPQKNEEETEQFLENRKRISISGVQEKLSLLLEKNQLRLTRQGEQGTYILKPIPRDLKKVDQVPANEHLTMQIASQVFGINTAENGLIFFKDGTPAYITRRFDVKQDGSKWGKEDFATLAGLTSQTGGPNFKYGYSYEEAAQLIRRYVPAWQIEIEKFFTLIVFNYLFSNGDAHLKNFALLETISGDHFLSPAYDLINTRIHVDDTDFALDKGLFSDDFASADYKKTLHRSLDDFLEFGRRIGIETIRIEKLIAPFLVKQDKVKSLISRSFLSEQTKRGYMHILSTKRNWFLRKNKN